MDSQQYKQFWDALNQPMTVTLMDLREALLAKTEFAGKFDFGSVSLMENEDDCCAYFIINDIRGQNARSVVAVDFELRDESNGANICLTVDDIEDQTSDFTYIPANYTDDVVTLDFAELQERVTQVPFDSLVERTEELLRKLLAKPAQ